MPEGWCWYHLNDIGKWQSGATPSRGVKAFFGGSIPWLKTGDLNDDYVNDIPERITDKALKETSVKLNPEGSVLIAMYGATIGKVGILTFPATTNQACCACSEFCGVDNRFLFYFLISHREEFIRQAGGGAQPNISKEIIVNTPIPVPPIEEQKRIVREIEKWLSILKNIDKSSLFIQAGINACKAKILDLAIHGKLVPQDPSDEPAIELLKHINPDFKPSDNLHYETQQLFSLPKGWEWCSVKDYTKKVTDYVASGSFASLKENVRYYKSPNYAILVKTKDFANNFSEDLTYTDEHGYNFLENSHLYGGELIFSNVGSVGKIFKVPKMNMRMSLAPNAIMVKFHQDEQVSWFERVFQSPFGQESLRAIASATAIMKFNKTDFGILLIPVPPVSEQKRILNAIEALFVQLNCIYDTE